MDFDLHGDALARLWLVNLEAPALLSARGMNPTSSATSGKSESGGDETSLASGLSDPHQWVARHCDYLYRYALIRVRDSNAAEDLVQETLLAALQSRESYENGASERAWLTGILRHKIYDHFRRLSRERTLFENETWPEELEERFDDAGLWKRQPPCGPAEWGGDPAAMAQRKEFMVALKRCLGKLPSRCADAFVLREMDGTESEQIQELLGVSPANFWVLLHRARMQLRLCLEQNWLNL